MVIGIWLFPPPVRRVHGGLKSTHLKSAHYTFAGRTKNWMSEWMNELSKPEKSTVMTESFKKIVHAQLLSRVRLLVTPWTVAHQAPLSMGFPRQGYWSGFPFSPRDLPDPGIKPTSPAWQVDSLPLSHQGSPPEDGWVENDLLFWLLDKDNRHGTVFELMKSEIPRLRKLYRVSHLRPLLLWWKCQLLLGFSPFVFDSDSSYSVCSKYTFSIP